MKISTDQQGPAFKGNTKTPLRQPICIVTGLPSVRLEGSSAFSR
jgi:hypothetical protein